MRKLTKTLAAVTILAPAGAYPLGIGELELHSALNQNLNAEILLHLSAGENIANFQVNLASPEKFEQAGIPRNYFLSKIKFKPLVRSDGSVVIQLTSNEVLREPYLDFLLEVNWPKGSLYREFTVLVDPPATYQQPIIPVSSISPTRQPTISGIKAVSQHSSVSDTLNSGAYLTKRNDTLWEVAENIIANDSNVSVEQMMLALQAENPHAFYKNNVNALSAGRKLRIPDNDTILKLSKRQAVSEFRQQNNAWRSMTAPSPAKVTLENSSQVTPVTNNKQLTLLAPTQAEVSEQSVSSASSENSTNTDEAHPATAPDQENQEIQIRLEKLEQQLLVMQKMLEIKDEQLAVLQNQQQAPGIPLQTNLSEAADLSVEKSGVASPAEKMPAPEPVTPAQQIKKPFENHQQVKSKIKPKPIAKAPAKPKSEAGIDTYYLMVGGFGATILGLLGWVWWRQRKLEEEYSAESMFASSSEIVLPDTDQDLSLPVIDENSSYEVGTVGESSFLSEFIPGDIDSFETDQGEVDPISEADVYLAYGRYQQAEDLIRQAIQDRPDRDECKLKLLEIFYANEDREAFEAYARELAEEGKNADRDFWSKVAEMGNDICTDTSLYLLAENVDDDRNLAKFSIDQAGEDSDQAATELDLTAYDVTAEAAVENNAIDTDIEVVTAVTETDYAAQENDLEFTATDLTATEIESTQEIVSSNTEENTALDFDLSFSETEQDETVKSEKSGVDNNFVVDDQNSDATVDIDLHAFSDDTKEQQVFLDTEEKEGFDAGPEDLEESENQVGFAFPTESSSDLDLEDLSGSADGEDLDLSFDSAAPVTDLIDENFQGDSGVSDLTDIDEFETKIDLAKAYIDMGDEDAAKSIAEEVLEKGSDNQKQEAQSVLAKIH